VTIAIQVEPHSERLAVVKLNGRLDLLSAVEVKQKLAAVVAEGHTRLVVDLGEVSFIDSSGLGALISGLKAARIAGGDLRIARPDKQARYILQVSTLERVLAPYATVEEAIAAY
jgi:anti-sigma B factor antagonist